MEKIINSLIFALNFRVQDKIKHFPMIIFY
jgi:hypothetical protein